MTEGGSLVGSFGVLASELPWKFHWTRTRHTGFLERFQERIARRLPASPALAVRGNSVASGSIMKALIQFCPEGQCQIIVPPTFPESAAAELATYQPTKVKITSLLDLPGMNALNLSALVDSSGDLPLCLSVRQGLSSTPFPVIATTHGLSRSNMLHDFFLKVLACGACECDSLVCSSHASRTAVENIVAYVAEEFNSKFEAGLQLRARIDRIPLCVDTEVLKPGDKSALRKRLRLPAHAFIVLFLGYLSLVKTDLLPLLQVWQMIVRAKRGREMLLVIAGTGDQSYVEFLRARVQGLAIGSQVRFMLDLNDATKQSLLPAVDAFVSPADSLQESFGLAPIEAMACGVPQVVSDWNGYRDTVVHNETGFLVPSRWAPCDDDLKVTGSFLSGFFDHVCLGQSVAIDQRVLRDYLELLLENEPLRREMGENSRRRAESNFSLPAVAKQYHALRLELSAIARALDRPMFGSLHTPSSYFRLFGHYASSRLEATTCLLLTEFGIAVLRGLEPLPLHPWLMRTQILEEKTLRGILSKLNRPGDDCPSQTVRDLMLALGAQREAKMTRQILWLLKQGLIESDMTYSPKAAQSEL